MDACRWSTKSIPGSPYVTFLRWVSHYGCQYVAHGDDITSDSSGEDCYRFVKAAGRFLVFKRTPSISTTDLVGRILLCTKSHFISSLHRRLVGEEGEGDADERRMTGVAMMQRIRDYATDSTGTNPHVAVYTWDAGASRNAGAETRGSAFTELVKGLQPETGQRIVYVDGGFDLFSSGHIEFLKQVVRAEEEFQKSKASSSGAVTPPYIVAGVHDDAIVNEHKGSNQPIMNIFERGLCVLQCRVSHPSIFFHSIVHFLE